MSEYREPASLVNPTNEEVELAEVEMWRLMYEHGFSDEERLRLWRCARTLWWHGWNEGWVTGREYGQGSK